MLVRAIAIVCLVFVSFPSDALSEETQYVTTYYEFPYNFTAQLGVSSTVLQLGLAVSTRYDVSVMANVDAIQITIRDRILRVMSEFCEGEIGDTDGRTDLAIAIQDAVNASLIEQGFFGGIEGAHFSNFSIIPRAFKGSAECSAGQSAEREKNRKIVLTAKNLTEEQEKRKADLAAKKLAEEQEKRANALAAAQKRAAEEQEKRANALAVAQKRAAEADKLIAVGSGSSFAVNAEGTFISNQHVIDGCSKIELMKSGKPLEASVVASDERNDLALIRVSDPIDQEVFFRLNDEPIKVMDDVFVGGYPFGNLLGKNVKVTSGIVSSMAGINDDVSQLMIDAAIQPGNSGGPIFLRDGKLAAVTVASLDSLTILKTADALPQNTNFGIKLSVLREFLSANNVAIPEQSFFTRDFERDDLVNEAILQVICYARKGDVQKLKQRKVLFDALMKE